MKKRALISVFNKDGILELASFLTEAGSPPQGSPQQGSPQQRWEIISTGGTFKYLQDNNIPVIDVSSVTNFPECLDGRVKTLHPAVHAGILARGDVKSHVDTLNELNIQKIDLVCVNLYPFFEKVQAGLSLEETIEFIDIGGPAMLRSAAKNYKDVIVLTDPADYAQAMEIIKQGAVSPAQSAAQSDNTDTIEFKKKLAGKVFALTSAYDAAVARYLLNEEYPRFLPLSMQKEQELRYGENAHQSAALYLNTDKPGAIGGMEQLHGKELGYNNIKDLDLAWKAACAFGFDSEFLPAEDNLVNQFFSEVNKKSCCVAVKHNTPCGFALAGTLLEAFEKVYFCDPVSIFGGIIACNTKVDAATAFRLNEIFLEIVAAPDFDNDALEILKKKKNLRIIKMKNAPAETHEYTAVDGGLLVQQTDRCLLEKWEVVTKTSPAACDIPDMLFGMTAVTYVKSNAIVIVKEQAATGIGGGQVNRIWPAKQSLERSAAMLKKAQDSINYPDLPKFPWNDTGSARVLASDAFFPFADIVEAAAASGIKAIIQPGGSINDKLSIEACDNHGIAMVFTGTRHFKH